MAKCVSEIDNNLKPLDADQPAYSVAEAEASLPYLRHCVRENFRLTPVFTMPLARRVVAPEGVVIAGRHIKQGVSDSPIHVHAEYSLTMTFRPLLRSATMPFTIIQKFGAKTTTYSAPKDGRHRKWRSERDF